MPIGSGRAIRQHPVHEAEPTCGNEMRLYDISAEEVEAVAATPFVREVDERGNVRLTAEIGDGRRILVVVAGDDPGFVITVFPRS